MDARRLSVCISTLTKNALLYLLDASNVTSNVINRHRILNGQPMTLALCTSTINEYTRIGCEACKRNANVGVNHQNLLNGTLLLKLCD